MSGAARGRLLLLVKVLGTVALVAFLLTKLPLREVEAALEHPRWGWLFVSFGLYAVSAVAGAWQWALILRGVGVGATWGEVSRLYHIGLFFNNFLPANIGGDAWKILDLGARDGRRAGVLAATMLDRLIGLAALTVLGCLAMGVAAATNVPLPQVAFVLAPIGAGLFAILAALLSRRLGALLVGLAGRLGLDRLAGPLTRFTDDLARLRPRVAWLNGVFVLSLGIQALRLVTHLAAARGLGLDLRVAASLQLLVLIPVLALSLTLPISINGIGLRESISASLLTWAGLAAPQAVAMELAAYLVQVAYSLVGGAMLWRRRRPGAAGGPEPAPASSSGAGAEAAGNP
jgi:glycosyltransferase 2 family protein